MYYADGAIGTAPGDDLSGRPSRPSAASAAYRDEVNRLIGAFGSYVRSQPWGKRIVGVRPCWGIYWEWHVYGMYHSPDVGPAMTAAFHRWKNGRYANVPPPTEAERTHGGLLLDPVRDSKTIDFFECLQTEVADCLLGAARACKRALPGRLVGAYYGYVFTAHPPEGANVMLDKVLSAPEIDFLSDPTTYSPGSRRAGGAYYHRTVPATFHRYGKLVLIEDDMRFDHVLPYLKGARREAEYCTSSPRESKMTMRRNYLNRLFDGCGIQIFDPGGMPGLGVRPSAHDNPVVLSELHESMRVSRLVGNVSDVSGNDTAVVVDWRECLRHDKKSCRDKSLRQIYDRGLEFAYRSGATFDVMTADDYLASPVKYRKAVFMNIFNPDDPILNGLSKKITRDGAKVARLMLPGARLGLFGAAVREIADSPDGETAWADIFASLGTHLYTTPGNYVRRQGNLLLFHTAAEMQQVVRLPTDWQSVKMTEMFSGRTFEGPELRFKTVGSDTLLFKVCGSSQFCQGK